MKETLRGKILQIINNQIVLSKDEGVLRYAPEYAADLIYREVIRQLPLTTSDADLADVPTEKLFAVTMFAYFLDEAEDTRMITPSQKYEIKHWISKKIEK